MRRRAENEIAQSEIEHKDDFYIPSLSCRTIVYKGLMLAPQIEKFYYELANPLVASALCLVHQRFSTNTFPSWKLAHPYRYMAHNGEINTIRGNISWMSARQSVMQSPLYDGKIDKLYPVIVPGGSDSASIDNAVEFLLPVGPVAAPCDGHADSRGVGGQSGDGPEKRAFYEYHASLMEPWDGPAAVCFTDGRVVGATLDRNGLRPGRYIVTKDDLVVLASEVGVIEVPPEDVRKKGRLQPGRMFLVDTVEHRIISDEEIKKSLAGRQPYGEWLKEQQVLLDDLPEPWRVIESDPETLLRRQRACGYSEEDLKILLGPMGSKGEEPIGSMGSGRSAGLPLRPAAATVQLLQAALRAGDQSADRPHPRRAGDVVDQLHRDGAQHSERGAGELPHAEASASDPDQSRVWRSCGGSLRAICWRPRCRRCSARRMARPG